MISPPPHLTICFAHTAYRLEERFAPMEPAVNTFSVRDRETPLGRIGEAEVLVISGLWDNALLDRATKLRYIQSIGAGTDQFDRDRLAAGGIRLASARGVNYRAVAEHAMALILALSRQLPEARDNQKAHRWRGMIGDLSQREDELGGKRLLIVGLGQIGGRLAEIAKAFDMRVDGLRRDPALGRGAADGVHPMAARSALVSDSDFIALTCPLTRETENLIDGAGADESLGLPGQCGARPGRRRSGADPGARRTSHRRRGARRDRRRAARPRFTALGHGSRADHAAHGRRDPPI
jgi:phosphoglycerate dehydrogenase-like enzyme